MKEWIINLGVSLTLMVCPLAWCETSFGDETIDALRQDAE